MNARHELLLGIILILSRVCNDITPCKPTDIVGLNATLYLLLHFDLPSPFCPAPFPVYLASATKGTVCTPSSSTINLRI